MTKLRKEKANTFGRYRRDGGCTSAIAALLNVILACGSSNADPITQRKPESMRDITKSGHWVPAEYYFPGTKTTCFMEGPGSVATVQRALTDILKRAGVEDQYHRRGGGSWYMGVWQRWSYACHSDLTELASGVWDNLVVTPWHYWDESRQVVDPKFHQLWSPVHHEVSAATRLYSLACYNNPNARLFLVHSPWFEPPTPKQEVLWPESFDESIEIAERQLDVGFHAMSRMADIVAARYGGTSKVSIVPSADAELAFLKLAAAGKVPGIKSTHQIYNSPKGSSWMDHLDALVHLFVVYGVDPRELPPIDSKTIERLGGNMDHATARKLDQLLRSIAAYVSLRHPYANLGIAADSQLPSLPIQLKKIPRGRSSFSPIVEQQSNIANAIVPSGASIVNVIALDDPTEILVEFDRTLELAAALNVENYTVSPDIEVRSVQPGWDGRTFILKTTHMTAGNQYRLKIGEREEQFKYATTQWKLVDRDRHNNLSPFIAPNHRYLNIEASGYGLKTPKDVRAEYRDKALPTEGDEFSAWYREGVEGDFDFRVKVMARSTNYKSRRGLVGIVAGPNLTQPIESGLAYVGVRGFDDGAVRPSFVPEIEAGYHQPNEPYRRERLERPQPRNRDRNSIWFRLVRHENTLTAFFVNDAATYYEGRENFNRDELWTKIWKMAVPANAATMQVGLFVAGEEVGSNSTVIASFELGPDCWRN